MRVATETDIPHLEPLYLGAIQHAFEVEGYIDWDKEAIGQTIGNYVVTKEMYIFEEPGKTLDSNNKPPLYIAGAVRLNTTPDPQIWEDGWPAAYFGKAATARPPATPDYFRNRMLPKMIEWGRSQEKDALRADCIHPGLLRFYMSCGFRDLGRKDIVEDGKKLEIRLLEMTL